MDGVIEDTEEFPGNYILYNKDDDDMDDVNDYADYDNPAEDDLVKIMPHWTEPAHCEVDPEDNITGTVTFNLSPVDTKVKVWIPHPDYPTVNILKYAPLSFLPDPPVYETPDDLPKIFYVEGIEPSDGPRDVVFTLTHNGLGFVDTVKVTVIHVELFIDANYTKPLVDWPKDANHPRSPKYMFGETDPIYVQVKNIGKDPDVAEDFNEAVVAKAIYSDYIYTDLKETGADTQIFRNSIAGRGELLYPSTEDVDDYPTTMDPDRIKVVNEEVVYFYLSIPPGNTSNYKWSEDVMVDRAEIGTEFQEDYHIYCEHPNPPFVELETEKFGGQLHDHIGGAPGLVWFKNFRNKDLDSQQVHWHKYSDDFYADAVDFVSWSGHNTYVDPLIHLHFFNAGSGCDIFPRASTNLGDTDAEWVIFDTCYSLWGYTENLKAELLTSGRCAHMFLGFDSTARWPYPDNGEYFAQRLEDTTIQQAWFDYCDYRQYKGTKVRVLRPIGPLYDYSDESLAGPGPIQVLRDPIASDDWQIKAHINTIGP